MTPILIPIRASLRTTDGIVPLALSDLAEQDARKRVRDGEGPSIAWQIQHMLVSRYKILNLLGSRQECSIEEGDDTDIEQLLRQWQEVEQKLGAVMESATDETLNRSVETGPHGEKTALDRVVFLIWHEAYHIGALGGIRKALGFAGPAELVMASIGHQENLARQV
jgi:uncharacterized damage-inducible protein DinB